VRVSCYVALITALVVTVAAFAQPPPRQPNKKKKNEDKEPVTQTLPVLRDPPGAAAGDTNKLVFHVSPLSDKGLLTPQTRDALNALMKLNRGAQIVKLRAFVAGTGDMRRVQTIVSEVFTDKKQPLPALSTIQVGGLPMEGAQVVIESVSVDKKPTHANGLVFFSGQRSTNAPLAIAQLDAAAKTAGVTANGLLRITCFLSSFDGIEAGRASAAHTFPTAAADFVQALRASADSFAFCEGVGDRTQTGDAVHFIPSAVLVSSPKLVFSGTQMAFRDQDADLRLAFQRLQRVLEPLSVSYKDVVFSSIYALSRAMLERTSEISDEFFPRDPRVPTTALTFEGLPSLDASMAIEVIAASRN
jgi:enamine deaminase RidA (YjgF/YER057c/UK114 family)